MRKWEYKTIWWDTKIQDIEGSDMLEEALNEYGYDGWEVITITHQVGSSNLTDEGIVSHVDTEGFVIVMKRQYLEDTGEETYSFE